MSQNCNSSEKTAFLRYLQVAHAQNARAGAYARKFLKCLKWPEMDFGLIHEWFWAFLNFARALTRGRTRTRAFKMLELFRLIWIFIMPNMNEKWHSVMKIWSWDDFYKMAPGWRHDDPMTLKMTRNPRSRYDWWFLKIWRKMIQPVPRSRLHKKVGTNKKNNEI